MGRFDHLTAGSTVTLNTRGYSGTRTEHTVGHATPEHVFVDGRSFRRSDGREAGSAPCDHRCPRLEVS